MWRGPTAVESCERHDLPSVLFPAAVVAAILPIAVATGRAIHRGWIPIGDQAIFAIRSRDVLTEHHPLLGTRTSLANLTDLPLNNPGPLLYDLFAVPSRLVDGGAGLALAVALVNVASVLAIAIVAHRQGGPLVGTAAMPAAATLGWAMGSELLYDPVQSQSLLFPFLAFLLLVWSVSCGDLATVPWAVGVGSLLLQTHLSYGLLVIALGTWAIFGLVLDLHRRASDAAEREKVRPSVVRALAISAVVFTVAWSQPVAEQLTSDEGNLHLLARAVFVDIDTIGLARGAQVFTSVVGLPPLLLGDLAISSPPSAGVAIVSFAVLVAVLGLCARSARRRRDHASVRAVATVAVGLVAGVATAARTPETPFAPLGVAPHHVRWMWPLGVFALFGIVVTLVSHLRAVEPRAKLVAGTSVGLSLAVVAAAAFTIPTRYEGAAERAVVATAIRDLVVQLDDLERAGPLLVDLPSSAFDQYGPTVLAELQRRGIPFLLSRPKPLRQLGHSRRFDGKNAQATLYVRSGLDAEQGPPGTRRIALHDGLLQDERHEFEVLRDQIGGYVRQGRLRLTPLGRAAAGALPGDAQGNQGSVIDDDPEFLASPRLPGLVENGHLALDRVWRPRFERYVRLLQLARAQTVALHLGPIP